MAAKKREIYARAAVQLRTHDRPREAERICPGAMGLYLFLLLQARGEQTPGDVSEAAALESWSAPVAYRKKQIAALVTVGLLVRTEGGRLQIVKYDEHNDTPADIAAAREADRIRKENSRRPKSVTRDIDRTGPVGHGDVPISISYSLSGSGSQEGVQGEETTGVRVAVPDPANPAPDWWGQMLDGIAMDTGVRLPDREAWLRYAGHRRGKGRPAERGDAIYWLTTVMVPEARKDLREASDRREREAKWDRQRAGPGTLTERRVETPEEQEANARKLAERIAARKARQGAA